MNGNRPILVTGAHRSGTTWVGKMLSSSPSVGYIHEPFGVNFGKEVCSADFDHWYIYLNSFNEQKYLKPISNLLEFKHDLIGSFIRSKGARAKARSLAYHFKFMKYSMSNLRPLIKDPIALVSAEWLYTRFNTDVVVMIRHPAAFACSVMSLGWEHQFRSFLDQKELMHDHLFLFEDEMKYAINNKNMDRISNAALVWKILHHLISKYKAAHPDWTFIRHEDLSTDPMNKFEALFTALNLDFGDAERQTVYSHSFSTKTKWNRPWDVRRNSASNLDRWKQQLSADEIKKLRLNVEEVSKEFYPDDEWE